MLWKQRFSFDGSIEKSMSAEKSLSIASANGVADAAFQKTSL
jgi:hypothetical protein